ncbi:hypothetical protein [Pyrococcus horikoshii]|uniref:Uncharacterized protein n=2 Tax=Pyrococcus horikoshii TaxID=53953 RepID=O58897_PYRHO|nr:hypothetical protein [Pyrococcus horikoshii]BAA30299.1 117aa long hypothetical protein [Pyrococcus horikoshii OT3]HII60211.1 hypothetical protein [Pyrococcus horikoshii]
MRSKSLIQLIIFLLIVGLWFKIAWPLQDKVSLLAGAIGGLILHWALTNKGNKNVVYIKPFTAGWRVLLYDMLLLSFLIALLRNYDYTLLDALKNNTQNLVLLLTIVGGIFIDYGMEG